MIRTLFLTIILTLIFTYESGYTHSGGLDSKGGHNNRKTGEYHYHRAKPPPPTQETTNTQDPHNTQTNYTEIALIITAISSTILLTIVINKEKETLKPFIQKVINKIRKEGDPRS